VIVKTKQTILIGVYEGGVQAGNCNTVVEKMADYLCSVGY
jgi:profilin